MTVFIVSARTDVEDIEVLGVFSSKETAQNFIDMEQGRHDFIFIDEWEVQ